MFLKENCSLSTAASLQYCQELFLNTWCVFSFRCGDL